MENCTTFFLIVLCSILMIDLHTHSTASDGELEPSELIKKAAENGITVIALTDHDTISGHSEAKKAAENENIVFVPGIEITIEQPFCEFHLLGLGIENPSESLYRIIEKVQKNRKDRNQRITNHLNEAGISVTLEEIQSEFEGQTLGRPHFAKWMAEHDIVKNVQDAFDKYLGRGRPWFEQHEGTNLEDAIPAIYESAGLPVIAHPMSLYLSWGKMDSAFANFKEKGIAGIEAFHPGARMTECLRLEELARKHNFFVTAGSDFHGPKVRRDRKLGHTCNDRKIDDKFYFEELLPALENARKKN